MKTWYITYISSSDNDCCTVWTKANSKQDAIDYVKSEYWDVKKIIEAYSE